MHAEWEAAKQIGLEASWQDSIPIAKAVGGYRIDNMARMDCLAYLLQLADLVKQGGGTIFEMTMVSGPTENNPTSLKTSSGNVKFEHVVCAVHCNFTDSQRLYLQTPPYQSYVIAAKIAPVLPDALFWDDSHPYYYVRRATVDGHTILAGGRDHRTGDGDEMQALAELESWVGERFEVQEIGSRWSAELFEPTDGLPFIGNVPGKENVWIATGLSCVGLTLGTAAGPLVAELINGKLHPLQETLSPSRIPVGSATNMIAEQLPAVANMAHRKRTSAFLRSMPSPDRSAFDKRPAAIRQDCMGRFMPEKISCCNRDTWTERKEITRTFLRCPSGWPSISSLRVADCRSA